ncbi:YegP family protein [Mesorhizobium sp. 2RAF45]|uniref:YegP family protein n=1 Tax=Mesorhizobium sp. 2RAF45 TaxID=3233001 RepID=UPI003F97D25D
MHYRLYKDRINQWRWRLIAANGKTLADSGESYWNKADAQHAIDLVKGSYSAPVYE